ncbi:MAG: FKBP-type peptidyl-prolyl cis-trans isomerase [Nitrospiraceae bacterium]|nr:FKBP-type peptidyl-prolyl cis-trans isomerase [Nitrospiraceae bacterium]
MKRISGLKLLEEREGEGRPAQRGSPVVDNMRLFLGKGEEVPLNEKQAEHLSKEMIRVENGITFVDRTIRLGQREVIAGVEHALIGMKAGGYRKVRISPHFAYRNEGVLDLIPADAVLIVEVRLREIIQKRTVHAS